MSGGRPSRDAERRRIAADVAAFLDRGGRIERIPDGATAIGPVAIRDTLAPGRAYTVRGNG